VAKPLIVDITQTCKIGKFEFSGKIMINSYRNFSSLISRLQSLLLLSLLGIFMTSLTACNSEPPKLMPAVKQFATEKEKEAHLSHIRKDHMDLLLHKRDMTVKKGIRIQESSLKACINCHVPEQHNGKVLRHTDPEHFCSTCHGYVAAQLDCFQCHVDHPVSTTGATAKAPDDHVHKSVLANNATTTDQKQKNSIDSVVKGESASE